MNYEGKLDLPNESLVNGKVLRALTFKIAGRFQVECFKFSIRPCLYSNALIAQYDENIPSLITSVV